MRCWRRFPTAVAVTTVVCSSLWAEAEEARYDTLIMQAAAHIGRGFGPSEEEARATHEAIRELQKDTESVTEHIVGGLAKGKAGAGPGRPGLREFGYVLWRLGAKCVLALEPEVLGSEDERVRRVGACILGMGGYKGGRDSPEVAELAVRVLQRDKDPGVQAAAIRALESLRATEQHGSVGNFLSSEHPQVRMAAVAFFWSDRRPEARPALEELLKGETDRGVCFLLARTVVKYEDFPFEPLLLSDRAGLREGVLFSLTQGELSRRGADWRLALPLVQKERDPRCRAQLGHLLVNRGEPSGIPLLVEVLTWQKDVTTNAGSDCKPHALSTLATLTNLPFYLTDEDRRLAREGRNLCERVSRLYTQWWNANSERIRWNPETLRFFVADEE